MTKEEEFKSFKEGDIIVSPSSGRGIFCHHHRENMGYIEYITPNRGWPRSTSIKEKYRSRATDRYWCIGMYDGFKKESSIEEGGVPKKWHIRWRCKQDCEDTNAHFNKRLLYVENSITEHNGDWHPDGYSINSPEISMETFRREIMKKPVGNKWGFKPGDRIQRHSVRGTYVRDAGRDDGIVLRDDTQREFGISMLDWKKEEKGLVWSTSPSTRGGIGIWEQMQTAPTHYEREIKMHTGSKGIEAWTDIWDEWLNPLPKGVEKLPKPLIIKRRERKHKILNERL